MLFASGFINLVEQFTELRETFYLKDHRFIHCEHNSGTAGWRRCIARSGKRHGPSMLSEGPLEPPCAQSPWVFMEASLHRHD